MTKLSGTAARISGAFMRATALPGSGSAHEAGPSLGPEPRYHQHHCGRMPRDIAQESGKTPVRLRDEVVVVPAHLVG